VDVESAIIRTPDGGVVLVPSGCYLGEERCLGVARELASLRAETATLKATPAQTPALVVVMLVLGGVLGFGAGLAVGSALLR